MDGREMEDGWKRDGGGMKNGSRSGRREMEKEWR